MEWLYSLFLEHSALQAVVVLSLISAIGLGLGRVHFWGVSLGVTFVFFAGILAGHLGLSVDPQMLNYAESFGLVIFVYSLGLHNLMWHFIISANWDYSLLHALEFQRSIWSHRMRLFHQSMRSCCHHVPLICGNVSR